MWKCRVPSPCLACPTSGCPWLISLHVKCRLSAYHLQSISSGASGKTSLFPVPCYHSSLILLGQGLSRFLPVTSSVLFSSPVVWHTVLRTLFGNLPAKCIHYSGTGWYPCAALGLLDTFPGVPSCMLLAQHADSLPLEPCICSLILETFYFCSLLTSCPFLPSEEGVPTPSTGLDFFFSVPS